MLCRRAVPHWHVLVRLDVVREGQLDRNGNRHYCECLSPPLHLRFSLTVFEADECNKQLFIWAVFIMYLAVFTYLADW